MFCGENGTVTPPSLRERVRHKPRIARLEEFDGGTQLLISSASALNYRICKWKQ